MADDEAQQPTTGAAQRIEVIGDATPEQVAALVTVLAAAAAGSTDAGKSRNASPWSAPARRLRPTLTPGTRASGAWRTSLR